MRLSGIDFRGDYNGKGSLGVRLQGVNLSETDLRAAQLPGAELQWANLSAADLTDADLHEARLMEAVLSHANLRNADLHESNINDARAPYAVFNGCNLAGAYLWGSDFREADFRGANLTGANLRNSQLVRAKFQKAILVGCDVFGVAAWELELEGADQQDLNVNRPGECPVLVEDLEVAQFIYLLLDNKKIRDIIDTITSKVVLILGRFTLTRKAVLDRLRDELRHHNLVPVLFDFTKPASKDVTGTVEILARMARFIVADLTDPSSIPHELATIVPFLRTTPVVPLRLAGTSGYGMFDDLEKAYDWVLPVHEYHTLEELIKGIEAIVIIPAEETRRLLTGSRPGITSDYRA